MKQLIVKLSTGYCGMDSYDALLVDDDATEDFINEQVYQMAVEHAAAYGIYPRDEYDEDDSEDEFYSDNIEGYVVGEYNPEEHDMYRSGGGSFREDFNGSLA